MLVVASLVDRAIRREGQAEYDDSHYYNGAHALIEMQDPRRILLYFELDVGPVLGRDPWAHLSTRRPTPCTVPTRYAQVCLLLRHIPYPHQNGE
jgi:hypothetical protein